MILNYHWTQLFLLSIDKYYYNDGKHNIVTIYIIIIICISLDVINIYYELYIIISIIVVIMLYISLIYNYTYMWKSICIISHYLYVSDINICIKYLVITYFIIISMCIFIYKLYT